MDNIITDSNREYTQENYLKVENCTLTSACVNRYLGKEIKGYDILKLDANKTYGILRPKEELEKALPTLNDIPIVDNHHFVLPDNSNKQKWLGTVSGHAHFEGDDVVNNLALWDQKAVAYVESADKNGYGGKKDLSVGYTYRLEKKSGTYKGVHYDFVMRDIKANHLALVKEGRVEPARIADNNFSKGNNLMKKGLVGMLLDSFMGDKKATDNNLLIKSMKDLACKDAENFEGGEIEQAKAIIELAKKIEASEKVEDDVNYGGKTEKKGQYVYNKDAENAEEKEAKEKEAKDKKLKDAEEAKERTKAEDTLELVNKYLSEKNRVEKLCTGLIGRISDSKITDSSPEELVDITLKAKGIDCSNKPYEVKIGMIEALSAYKNKQFITQTATDSKRSSSPRVVNPFVK